jgi:hypothetical protein
VGEGHPGRGEPDPDVAERHRVSELGFSGVGAIEAHSEKTSSVRRGRCGRGSSQPCWERSSSGPWEVSATYPRTRRPQWTTRRA